MESVEYLKLGEEITKLLIGNVLVLPEEDHLHTNLNKAVFDFSGLLLSFVDGNHLSDNLKHAGGLEVSARLVARNARSFRARP